MRLSRDRLLAESESSGFRPEILEKAIHLLSLLGQLSAQPQLTGKWALKGGTALNLFLLDAPRLSVDIDLNYIGQADREGMEADRPNVELAIAALCRREGYAITKSPSDHAGGKYNLRYTGAVTPTGTLQFDVNYVYRVPLFPVAMMNSRSVASYSSVHVPLMDVHEIAAGKLAALLSRHAARDLYDTHQLLRSGLLDPRKLRLAFVVYGAINRKDWRTVNSDEIMFDLPDLENQLVPVLRSGALSGVADRQAWAQELVDECRSALSVVLPFQANERKFLDLILNYGEVRPDLLTTDEILQNRISTHPGILWKALNVRRHTGR